MASQLAEAREELERLEFPASDRKARSEGALQAVLEHACHHINVPCGQQVPTAAALGTE